MVTKKRVDQLHSVVLPDKEIMEDFQMRYDSEMDVGWIAVIVIMIVMVKMMIVIIIKLII